MVGEGEITTATLSAFYVRFLSPLVEAARALTEIIPQSARLEAESAEIPTSPRRGKQPARCFLFSETNQSMEHGTSVFSGD